MSAIWLPVIIMVGVCASAFVKSFVPIGKRPKAKAARRAR